jgi:phage shock protein C
MSKFHKSNKNRTFLGVCGGLSESTGIDVSLIRIGFILGTIFSGSILLWIYLLLALVLPTED